MLKRAFERTKRMILLLNFHYNHKIEGILVNLLAVFLSDKLTAWLETSFDSNWK